MIRTGKDVRRVTKFVEDVEKELIRFRTTWSSGDPDAVVGFTDDLPLNTPIVFVKDENGRIGWKRWEAVPKPKEEGK